MAILISSFSKVKLLSFLMIFFCDFIYQYDYNFTIIIITNIMKQNKYYYCNISLVCCFFVCFL